MAQHAHSEVSKLEAVRMVGGGQQLVRLLKEAYDRRKISGEPGKFELCIGDVPGGRLFSWKEGEARKYGIVLSQLHPHDPARYQAAASPPSA